MQLKHYYWYFENALPERIRKDILEYGKLLKEEKAKTFGYRDKELSPSQEKQLDKKRNSTVVWMNDRWIYREIQPYVEIANENAGWNYHWDWSESCQFTKYEGSKKGHYNWHTDCGLTPNQNNKVRKLSMIIPLVDGNEYEGGDFELNLNNPENENNIITIKEAKIKGTVIVFPSFVWHRVTPVTSGTRYSLVNWHQGKPFV
jgi:PKHD-type hydroxylase